MTCEFNTALVRQVFDIFLIKRFAEAVAMRGFLPLRMRSGMAFGTTIGRNKIFAGDKCPGRGACVAGAERIAAKFIIVVLTNFFVVFGDVAFAFFSRIFSSDAVYEKCSGSEDKNYHYQSLQNVAVKYPIHIYLSF